MVIEALLEDGLCLFNILYPIYSARDEVYHIRCGICDVVFDLVRSIAATTDESIPLVHMILAEVHRLVSRLKLPC